MNAPEYHRGRGGGEPITVTRLSPAAGPLGPPVESPLLGATARATATQPGQPRVSSSSASRIFVIGFGLSLLLLLTEYLTGGRFPGWFVLVPSNPTTLLGALVGHQVEAAVGARWADEAFFATLGVESALWWYAVGVLAVVARRRRAR